MKFYKHILPTIFVVLCIFVVLGILKLTFGQQLISSGQTENFIEVNNLIPGETYHWYIVAKDGQDSSVSEVWSFTVDEELAVQLSSFTGTLVKDKVLLKWKTETEINNYGFQIEQSTGGAFSKIGFVLGSGNSNSPKEYFFEKELFESAIYQFRLKQIDTDGTFEYSHTVTIEFKPVDAYNLDLFPNPFNPQVSVNYFAHGKAKLIVYQFTGEEIMNVPVDAHGKGVIELNFSGRASGIYLFLLKGEDYILIKKGILIK